MFGLASFEGEGEARKSIVAVVYLPSSNHVLLVKKFAAQSRMKENMANRVCVASIQEGSPRREHPVSHASEHAAHLAAGKAFPKGKVHIYGRVFASAFRTVAAAS